MVPARVAARFRELRGRLTAEAIALEGLQLFEAGVVGSAGGGLVAMEFAHAVLLVIHVEECEDVARVGVEIVEGFEFDDGGFHGADASQSPGGGDELKHEVALDEVGRGEGVEVAKGKGLELVG
jgi:hypothetical protein